MLASPPLLPLLLLSFISAISTFVLLLLPILPSLSVPTLLGRRTLPRSFYPHLPPRPSSSAVSSVVHSVGIALAGTELVVTMLALWQQLLLYSTSAKHAGEDNVGEGIRMGLALILRPVVWTAIVAYLLIRNSRHDSSASRVDRSFNSVSTLSTPRTFATAAALVVAVGTIVGLFAGVSSASLASTYGLALVAGSLLMAVTTVGVAALAYQTLALKRRVLRPSSVRISQGEKEMFRRGEWRADDAAVYVEKQPFSKRGEGWGDGASWLESPSGSNASLPPFDLSLTPTSARNSAANITTSRPNTPNRARTPSPLYDATPDPVRTGSPTSWLSSPAEDDRPRPISPWSFASSTQTALTANITEASSGFRAVEGPPSPLFASSDPFASLQPVVAVRPPSRVVSIMSSRTSFAPLSPPPAIPLPPTPSMMSLSDGRPSTSTEFRPSFSDWTRPSTTAFHSTEAFTSVPAFGSIQGEERVLHKPAKRESVRESEDALIGQGVRRRNEHDAELGRTVVEGLDEADLCKLSRRAWLGVASLATAWLIWVLAMPSMIDCMTRPTTFAPKSLTLSLIVSFALSSPLTLVLYLCFRSAYFTPSSAPTYDHVTPYNHHRTNTGLSARAVSGLSFSDGPVRPSIDMDLDVPAIPVGKKALRRLTLVESNRLSTTTAGLQGRCISPNEEGNMAETWITNGLAKAETSRFSRALSMLGPNPPLQQLPSSRISYASMPAPPPRAASPASSYASSQNSRASASRMSALRDDPQETFASFRTRAQSTASVHHATIVTATRGTRGSMEMGKLVDLSPSASQTEFGVRPGGKGEVRVLEASQEQQGLSLDWMTSKLLPGLVPSIRVGKSVQVRPDVKVRPSAQEPAPSASILRTRSAYEPQPEVEEDIELTPRRPSSTFGIASRRSHAVTPPGSPPSPSNESTPRSNPRERMTGANAPTPSHGRSSSVEINGRGSVLFNSPSVMASTPLRSICQRSRPSPGSAHKAHFSLPPVSNGGGWGHEVRQALDQFSVGSRASLRSRRSYSVVNVQDEDDGAELAFLPDSTRRSTFGPIDETVPLDSVSERTGSDEEDESETEEEISVDEFDFGLDGFGDLDSVDVVSFDSHHQISLRPTTFQDHQSPPSTAGVESRHMSRDLEDLLAEMQVAPHPSASLADTSMPRTVSPPSAPRAQGLSSSLPLSATQHMRKPSEHDYDAGSPRPFYQPRLTLHRSASAASSVFSTMCSPSPSPMAQRSAVHVHGAQRVKTKQQSLDVGSKANRGLRPLSLSGSAVAAKSGNGSRLAGVGEQDENEELTHVSAGERKKTSLGSRILGDARPSWSARPIR